MTSQNEEVNSNLWLTIYVVREFPVIETCSSKVTVVVVVVVVVVVFIQHLLTH